MSTLNKLNTIALTLLITGAIDSIRNLPAIAMFGSSIIFFFLFAGFFFLLPTALVSAELASNIDNGGIYQWTRLAFGNRVGFFAVWLQWINNVAWFPTILSFVAGTIAYVFNPALAQNKFYLVSVVISSFWLLTLINLRGIRVSSKFTSFCAFIGVLIPISILACFLAVWLTDHRPLQIQLTSASIFPEWRHSGSWVALTAVILSFFGMELATVHINDVNEPQKTFPKALAISCSVIVITMMTGSLTIAYLIPGEQIHLVNGTIQTFGYFLTAYHMNWLIPVFTIMLVFGCLGGIVSWIVSPIKGMAQAAKHGFMPPFFQQVNRYGVPQNLMIAQAILVSFVCLTFLLFPSVNGSYWFLSSLTTQLYVIMYFIMFVTALRLRSRITYRRNTFVIPGKKLGLWLVCGAGLIGCTLTLIVGFIPPDNINVGSPWHYLTTYCGGMVIAIIPIVFFYRYQQQSATIVIADEAAEAA